MTKPIPYYYSSKKRHYTCINCKQDFLYKVYEHCPRCGIRFIGHFWKHKKFKNANKDIMFDKVYLRFESDNCLGGWEGCPCSFWFAIFPIHDEYRLERRKMWANTIREMKRREIPYKLSTHRYKKKRFCFD